MSEQVITLNIGKEPVKKYIWQRPKLYPKQEAAFFADNLAVCIEHAPGAGGTYGAMVWLFEQAMLANAGKEVWWIAPNSKHALHHLMHFESVISQTDFISKAIQRIIRLSNGVVIRFIAADNLDVVARMDAPFAILVDQAHRIRGSEIAAIHQTRFTQTRLIGHVADKGNWFYQLCRRAEASENCNAIYHRLTILDAIEADLYTAEEIEVIKLSIGEAAFNKLYLVEAAA